MHSLSSDTKMCCSSIAPSSSSLCHFIPKDMLCHSLHRNHDRSNNRSEKKVILP